jgi:thiamine-monophosphate kinase
MGFSEAEVIAELAGIFSRDDSRVIVGIGDDAAVVTSSLHQRVITTDMAVENVHFRREWSSPYDIGSKITAANLADIFAMGATPRHLVAAVSLTGNESMNWIRELAQGMKAEADKCDVSIIGGDIVRGPVVTISMTAFGEVATPILRSGGQVGDGIYLSALPGFSAAGLFLLSNEINISALVHAALAEKALAQFRSPNVDYAAGGAFSQAHSLCDVSDGLLTQGNQIAHASGVRLEIDSTLISALAEYHALLDLAEEVGAYVWDWIACGGEDHVFLATGRELSGLKIGTVVEGLDCEILGLAKPPKGFTHFL